MDREGSSGDVDVVETEEGDALLEPAQVDGLSKTAITVTDESGPPADDGEVLRAFGVKASLRPFVLLGAQSLLSLSPPAEDPAAALEWAQELMHDAARADTIVVGRAGEAVDLPLTPGAADHTAMAETTWALEATLVGDAPETWTTRQALVWVCGQRVVVPGERRLVALRHGSQSAERLDGAVLDLLVSADHTILYAPPGLKLRAEHLKAAVADAAELLPVEQKKWEVQP